MEKPKVPSKAELNIEKKRLREKHFRIHPDIDDLLKKYSKILKRSEAEIANEMLRIGIVAFELKYGLRSRIAPLMIGRDADLTKQLNDRVNLILEKKIAERAKKANDLSDAFGKMIVHGSKQDWERYNEYDGYVEEH
jgi:hypothetical protein